MPLATASFSTAAVSSPFQLGVGKRSEKWRKNRRREKDVGSQSPDILSPNAVGIAIGRRESSHCHSPSAGIIVTAPSLPRIVFD